MAERIFLGTCDLLPRLIARQMAQFAAGKLPDFGQFLLVLPGKLARKVVQQELLEIFPAGFLPPQMLTPHLLLHYQRENDPSLIPPAAEELLWDKALAKAVGKKEFYPQLFPGGRVPVLRSASGKSLRDLRRELVAGGVSIADAADALGARGKELAALEKLYLNELDFYGFTDHLQNDREAAMDTAAFAGVQKIILAGLPDLPKVLLDKLNAIDRDFPGKIQIWIGDDEEKADFYDQWGMPIAEKWKERHFDPDISNIHCAVDPADAARRAMLLAPDGVFDPSECAVVLADQSLYPEFAREFSRLYDEKNCPVTVMDPGGVPLSSLRLWKLGSALLDLLKSPDDFFAAENLLREEDFLNFCSGTAEKSNKLLIQLDEFKRFCMPDNFADALSLLRNKRHWHLLCRALQKIAVWQKYFTRLLPAEFLRKFFTAVLYHAPASPEDTVSLEQESAFWREKINDFALLPEKLFARTEKTAAIEALFNSCKEQKIPRFLPPGTIVFEGRLEMPFLRQKRIIFCGMNEEYFPDRIDLTTFLSDTVRLKIGIRSNKDTLTRSICHLLSACAGRNKNDLQIISLRKDAGGNALKPSTILFAGTSLPQDLLIARCRKLFTDPEALELPPSAAGEKEFTFHPQPEFPVQEENGMIKLNVTALDSYLFNPFSFFWERLHGMEETDYAVSDPGRQESGTICHKAFEMLEKGVKFASAEKLEAQLQENFSIALAGRFGSPLPVLVSLYAENMKQRLSYGAKYLFDMQQEGFELLATEYKLGGENNFVPFAGASFHGKIDRIDIDPIRKILRITDIKTGSVDSAEKTHCEVDKKTKEVKFKRLQLPAYAILLRHDPAFRELCPDMDQYRLECAYLALPVDVTDSDLSVWEWENFEKILPHAEEALYRTVGEIISTAKGTIKLDPQKITLPILMPDAKSALPDLNWDFEKEDEEKAKNGIIAEKFPFTPVKITERKKFPALPEDSGAGKTRCCFCTRKKSCPCLNGDCVDCKAFNGFKDFNIITASAGTGKTHTLASRFIQLLEFGVEPDSILAITFTKKAAGEIFDKLIDRFIELICEADKPQNSCRRVDPERFIALLRKLLAPNEKSLQISTIDSFFMKLLNSFAPELGIWGQINIIDQDDDRFLRQTLHNWIHYAADSNELADLRELLKEANPQNNDSIHNALYKLIGEIYPFYQLNAARDEQGNVYFNWDPPEEISSITMPGENTVLQTAELLRNETENLADHVLIRRLTALAGLLEKSAKGVIKGAVEKDVIDLLKMLNSKNSNRWLDGKAPGKLIYSNDAELDSKLSQALHTAFRHVRGAALSGSVRKNHAVFRLIANYDRIYNDFVRKAGNISFADLPFLLCSMDKETREVTLGSPDHSLEFRMDSRIDHYMFDEFQDTSDIQYRAFEPLLNELFTGFTKERFRSFFCVGDIKQSIYQWRFGNPELFNCVANSLRPVENARNYPVCSTLVRSYRTSQAVLDAVNAVFSDYDGEFDIFRYILEKMHFEPHISNFTGRPGHTALIEVDPGQNKIAAKSVVIAGILRHIMPFKRKLSVGVLVNTNDNVKDFAAHLRQATGMPVTCEGIITPADTMAFNVFRQLLIFALHPGDPQSENFFDMLAFGRSGEKAQKFSLEMIVDKLGLSPDMPPASALRLEIYFHGIEGLAKRFSDAFGKDCSSKEQERLQLLCRIAANFKGSYDEFLRRISSLGEADSCLDGTIQVMTTHKSKGLQFDIVFLPDLAVVNRGANSVLPKAAKVHYHAGQDYTQILMPEWISYTPAKDICANVAVLDEYQENAAKDRAFERACNLYVAMTRAKYALYMLTDPPPKSSKTYALDRVMSSRLIPYGVQNSDQELYDLLNDGDLQYVKKKLLFSHGEWHWYSMVKPELISLENTPDKVIHLPSVRSENEIIETASGAEKGAFTVIPAIRFSPVSGADLGTELHQMFEKIGFIESDFDPEVFCAACDPGREAAKIFCAAMEKDSPVRELFKHPGKECEVWREKRFIRKKAGNKIVPGAFDRVVIFRENGEISAAQIIDFKSDRMDNREDFLIYAPQLASYRESLSSLLDLPEEKISCRICALRSKQIIDLFS